MSGQNPFCCSGGSQQVWLLQVRDSRRGLAHLIPLGWERGAGFGETQNKQGHCFCQEQGAPASPESQKGHPSSWGGETPGFGSLWLGAGSQTQNLPHSLLSPMCTWEKKRPKSDGNSPQSGLSHLSPCLEQLGAPEEGLVCQVESFIPIPATSQIPPEGNFLL